MEMEIDAVPRGIEKQTEIVPLPEFVEENRGYYGWSRAEAESHELSCGLGFTPNRMSQSLVRQATAEGKKAANKGEAAWAWDWNGAVFGPVVLPGWAAWGGDPGEES
ncbi:hypothetical protein LguiB_016737 [Lonicera macranthoides]